MRFSVVGVDDLLTAIYDECDPADLERAVIESYSLLERHWEETLSLVSGSGDREVSQCALLDISAADVKEVCIQIRDFKINSVLSVRFSVILKLKRLYPVER